MNQKPNTVKCRFITDDGRIEDIPLFDPPKIIEQLQYNANGVTIITNLRPAYHLDHVTEDGVHVYMSQQPAPKEETNCCPFCLGVIPDETVRGWYKRIRYGASKKAAPCAGKRADGETCGRMLGARERLRPCPDCGYNNWRGGGSVYRHTTD